MDRRAFAGSLGLGVLAAGAAQAQIDLAVRDLYELRRYSLAAGERQAQFDAYLEKALVPGLSRLGIGPIGVFKPVDEKGEPSVYVLLVHHRCESVSAAAQIHLDPTYDAAAEEYLDLPPTAPLYNRYESSVLLAIAGMPRIAATQPGQPRLFELRCYESHNERSAAKKIEMFERAELDIFHRTGLPALFFGQALAGARLPNLTYMLAFESQAARDAGWKTFIADPEWKELAARPEYADSAIVSRITSTLLTPAPYSGI